MPLINLTTLSGQELRQRLDSSRARGDAALAYEILREMATRRAAETGRRPLLKRRAVEPHIVEAELGDPLEPSDDLPRMPYWRAPEPGQDVEAAAPAAPDGDGWGVAEPPPEPEPLVLTRETEPRRKRRSKAALRKGVEAVAPTDPDALPHFRMLETPLSLETSPPAAEVGVEPADLRLDFGHAARRDARPARGGHLRVAAGFAVGITAGVAMGWIAAGLNRDAAAPVAAPIEVARQTDAPAPAPAVLQVLAEPASVDVTPAQPVEVTEAAPDPMEPEPAPPQPVEIAEAPAPSSPALAAHPCAAEPTPADRAICADASLQRLQGDLRRAYADALDAHEDRALLRERQLAWRDARNDVSDPARLARLYEQRIQKLHAATAEARALR